MTYTLGNAATSALSFVSTNATAQGILTRNYNCGNFTINGAGGSWILQSDFNCNVFTLTTGAFNSNNWLVNVANIVATGALTRSFTFGTSTILLYSSTVAVLFNVGAQTSLSISAASATLIINDDTIDHSMTGFLYIWGTLDLNTVNSHTFTVNAGSSNVTFNTVTLGQGTLTIFANSTLKLGTLNGLQSGQLVGGSINGGTLDLSLAGRNDLSAVVTPITISNLTVVQARAFFALPTAGTNGGGNTNVVFVDASKSGTETGTGTDAVTRIGNSSSDTGTGADAVVRIGNSSADTGTAVFLQGESVSASLSSAETSAGIDSESGTAVLSDSNTGTGTDASTLAALPTSAETGAALNNETISASVTTSDVGSGTDAATIAAVLSGAAEQGTALDNGTIRATFTQSDSSSGNDAALLAALLAVAEAGVVAEAQAIIAAAAAAESTTFLEHGTTSALLTYADFAEAVDDSRLVVQFLDTDSAVGI
jgi:hypothetical protein